MVFRFLTVDFTNPKCYNNFGRAFGYLCKLKSRPETSIEYAVCGGNRVRIQVTDHGRSAADRASENSNESASAKSGMKIRSRNTTDKLRKRDCYAECSKKKCNGSGV